MIRNLVQCVTLATLASFATVRNASGGEQLDQFFEPDSIPNSVYTPFKEHSVAETFTVGLEGFLSRVDIGVIRQHDFRDADLNIAISRTKHGVPDFSDAARLATRVVPAEQVPIVKTGINEPMFDVSINVLGDQIAVRPGDVLAIWVYTQFADPEGYFWWATFDPNTQPYPGGSVFIAERDDGSDVYVSGSGVSHVQFRTFVETPEPSALVLSSIAVSLLAIRRRR